MELPRPPGPETLPLQAEGVQPAEIVALSDPTAKPGDKKNKKSDKGAGAMGALPGGSK